jgi:hypothetical protein
MNLTSLLFKAARLSAWTRAISKLAGGNAKPLLRRVRNKALFRVIGPILRK